MRTRASHTHSKPPSSALRIPRRIYSVDTNDTQGQPLKSGTIDMQALSNGNYLGTPVPRHILPGICSIGFWNAIGPQNWGVDAHHNNSVKIMFLETGRMPFFVDRKAFYLRAGNFTITRPWQLHQLGNPHIEPGKLHWLILEGGACQINHD